MAFAKASRPLEELQTLASATPPTTLNSPLRECLEAFASSHGYGFSQDSIGNVHITRPGSDSNIASVAIAFSVDYPSQAASLDCALTAFLGLQQRKTNSDITLLGWSSPGGITVGRDVWEGLYPASAGYDQTPELKTFASMSDPADFAFSAIFELMDDGSDELTVRGTPVLTTQCLAACTKARLPIVVAGGGPTSKRVPVASICGKGAAAAGTVAVEHYSEYVAALFENFD